MSPTLASGTTLRHYCVGSLIGRGGMGEVYEARDLVLERRVALKILSPELFDRPDRIRQFVQEAKRASALNHPHILTVHEIGEHDVDGARVHFMAMELVEGITLRQEIHQRHVPLRRVLNVLAQVADALAKAHESGIIHRDLKPDNIMVTADGYAKIIDFGLAKLTEPWISVAEGNDGADAVTVTKGGLTGTIGYMAPEQIEQKQVDARGDIFSFGCVLYEAVTGRRAFTGATVTEVLNNVLHKPPAPIEPPPDVDVGDLPAIVQRCLEKSPADRYHSMRDVALDLRAVGQRLGAEPKSGQRSGSGAIALKPPQVRAAWWRGRAAVAGLAVAVALAIGVLPRRNAGDAGTPLMRPLVRWPSDETGCRFSPDGAWVSFISDRDQKWGIWMRRTASGEPALLVTQPDRITSQLWSPSGDEIAYVTAGPDERVLHFIPPFGGAAPDSIVLDHRLREGRLVRWIGKDLYIESVEGLWRLERSTHAIAKVADAQSAEGARTFFDVRADGKRITYSVTRDQSYETVWLADADGGHAVCLTPLDGSTRYSDLLSRFASAGEDDVIFSSDRSGQVDLWRVDSSRKTARQITFSPNIEWVQDVAAGGAMIAFSEERNNSNLWLWNERTDEAHQMTAEAASDRWATLSAAGDLVAFQRTKPTLKRLTSFLDFDVYIARLSGGQLDNPRIAVADASFPALAPTGKWLAYVRPAKAEQNELWLKDLQSDRVLRISDQFELGSFYKFPLDRLESNMAWTPSGDALYFVAGDPKRQEIRRVIPATGQSTPLFRGEEGASLHGLHVSSDGRSLEYVRRWQGSVSRSEVVVRDLAAGRESTVFSRKSDWHERFFCLGWRENGDLLIVWAAVGADWTERLQAARITPEGRQTLTPIAEHGYGGTARFDPLSDSIVLTTIDANGFHELSRVSLDGSGAQPVARNGLPGISFSGIAVLPDGSIMFSKEEANSDLWLIDFQKR